MATITTFDDTGRIEFVVPFEESLRGGHFDGPAELLIVTGPPDVARRVCLRYYPTLFDFQARLFNLVKGTPLEKLGPSMSIDAAHGQPVVTFDGNAAIVSQVPDGLDSLEALERWLKMGPDLLHGPSYTFAAFEVLPQAAQAI